MGKIEIAKELIEFLKSCNADVAKFQARDNKLLLNYDRRTIQRPPSSTRKFLWQYLWRT